MSLYINVIWNSDLRPLLEKNILLALLIQVAPDNFTPMLIPVPTLCPQQSYKSKKPHDF